MADCDIVKKYLLKHLMEDVEAHEKGLYSEIGKAEPNMPNWDECEKENEVESERLAIAYSFWDGWIDARNHDWAYYPKVQQTDWPIIARQICLGLAEGWEPEKIANTFDFSFPARPPRVSLRQQLRKIFGLK